MPAARPVASRTLRHQDGPFAHRSLWLSEVLADYGDLSALEGSTRADVAVIGGGYLGLWTAIELKQHDPGLEVVLIEQDVCGGGPSGRNGGHAHSWWSLFPALQQVCGTEEAVRLCHATEKATERFEWLDSQGLDTGFRRDGFVQSATTAAQIDTWDPMLRAVEAAGGTALRRLTAEDVAHKTGSPAHIAGYWEPRGGTVHPGRLVLALRTLARKLGVTIYERTPVTNIVRSSPTITLKTPGGAVLAERVVLAAGAWMASMPEFVRRIFVVGSTLVATVRSPDRLAAIGWTHGASLCDAQDLVLYYQATADGRAVMGRGGGRVAYRGRIDHHYDLDLPAVKWTRDGLRRLYPSLATLPIEYQWSGPIDRALMHLPMFGDLDGDGRIFFGVGFSGTGVVQTAVGAQILTSLVLGQDDEWSNCPLVGLSQHKFPREPLRYLGAAVVQQAVRRQTRLYEQGGTPGPLTNAVASLVPKPSAG